jgi:hypothetical protein
MVHSQVQFQVRGKGKHEATPSNSILSNPFKLPSEGETVPSNQKEQHVLGLVTDRSSNRVVLHLPSCRHLPQSSGCALHLLPSCSLD